ncbi:hypothetical protein GCK72_022848 [Caenorhabditis remanei]|uniref:Uncharacterized protein n=1 Tax=Caenorhabditis remanei TaxID=31234 RepID=A0A6A5FV29_CAERE|nr:hypothetical protein GCK72_022848 [Caenorhabditis remanei]KAF1746394.1 hypothetical protein GCK72_022848 [Caenorhabditis remanei]
MTPITTIKNSIANNGADLIETKSSSVAQIQINRIVGLSVVLALFFSVPLALLVFMGLVWFIDRQEKNSKNN